MEAIEKMTEYIQSVVLWVLWLFDNDIVAAKLFYQEYNEFGSSDIG